MCSCKARPAAHLPGQDSAKPTAPSQGNFPAQLQGVPHKLCSVWVPLGGTQKPCVQVPQDYNGPQSHIGQRWVLEVWKPKRNTVSLPLSAKALMIIQRSGQFPVYLNTSHQKAITGPATDHLRELGKTLDRRLDCSNVTPEARETGRAMLQKSKSKIISNPEL